MKQRITYEVLKSGQARPYGPDVYRARYTFETQGIEGYSNPDAPFKPHPNYTGEKTRGYVRDLLRAMGVFPKYDDPPDWAAPKLVFFGETAPGVWEFETSAEYTD